MSIKSQKSLNEECSEIIERSYSVRSVSNESLSCDDEEETLATELMKKLSPGVLSKLRRCFTRSKDKRRREHDIDRRVEEVMRVAAAEEGIEFTRAESRGAAAGAGAGDETMWLGEDAFVDAIDGIFGHHKYSVHAHKLFQLLDPFSSGQVSWSQLICRLVKVGARRTRSRADAWTPIAEPEVFRLDHCKSETIVRLVCMQGSDWFCYAAVSRGGRVGVYSGDMQLMHQYEVFYHRSGVRRRVKNCWITDAVYMSDVQTLALTASDRSLTMYDAATRAHAPLHCITGLKDIPTCVSYCPSSAGCCPELALGSERGDVTRMRFLQPAVALLPAREQRHINYYFWMELSSPPYTSYVSLCTHRRAHSRAVRRVRWARHNLLLSCSHDSDVSVRARHVPHKLPDYLFKVQRGVSCFHFVPSLHVLAAGSCDGAVRLWESTQSAPFARLVVPARTPVLDVVVLAARNLVLAVSADCKVHLWDMHEECLLQTIRIRFPFLGVLGKKLDFGAACIHPGPARGECVAPSPRTRAESPGPGGAGSRRGSSVYHGSTGGLMLLDEDDQPEPGGLEADPEYILYNRAELLVTCCDYVCVVTLAPELKSAPVLPPPGDTLRARRPSAWDLPGDVFRGHASSASSKSSTPPPQLLSAPAPQPSTMWLSPASAVHPQPDLETLLNNAGLQGILEKDFVLSAGLKHDLNRKLAELEANKSAVTEAVSLGAPYLALRTSELLPLPPVDDMLARYQRVMRLFPSSSVCTPAGSEASTPRRKNAS